MPVGRRLLTLGHEQHAFGQGAEWRHSDYAILTLDLANLVCDVFHLCQRHSCLHQVIVLEQD